MQRVCMPLRQAAADAQQVQGHDKHFIIADCDIGLDALKTVLLARPK